MRLAIAAVPFLLLTAGPALGQTREAQFGVRAMVFADCSVNVTDLNFGVYDSESDERGSTIIYVRCTPGSAAAISLSAGNSGNPQLRFMSGPDNLRYQLFRDIALNDPIDTTGTAFVLGGLENNGQIFPFPVYGEIPRGQAVRAGSYADIIRVTVQF